MAVREPDRDLQPDAGQPARRRPLVQLAREPFRREHHPLGLLGGRVEVAAHRQVRRAPDGGERARLLAARQPVRERAVRAEPPGDVPGRQRREVAERPDS